MKRMTVSAAMKIIHFYSGQKNYTEDEAAEYIEAMEYMLDHEPFVENAWLFNLAHLYDQIGKYDLAVKYYNLCIKDNAVGYIGLGDTYRHMKEYEKAYACYMKAREHGFHKAASRIEDLIKEQEEYHGSHKD